MYKCNIYISVFFGGTSKIKRNWTSKMKKRYFAPPVTTVKNINAKSIVARELKILKLSLLILLWYYWGCCLCGWCYYYRKKKTKTKQIWSLLLLLLLGWFCCYWKKQKNLVIITSGHWKRKNGLLARAVQVVVDCPKMAALKNNFVNIININLRHKKIF